MLIMKRISRSQSGRSRWNQRTLAGLLSMGMALAITSGCASDPGPFGPDKSSLVAACNTQRDAIAKNQTDVGGGVCR